MLSSSLCLELKNKKKTKKQTKQNKQKQKQKTTEPSSIRFIELVFPLVFVLAVTRHLYRIAHNLVLDLPHTYSLGRPYYRTCVKDRNGVSLDRFCFPHTSTHTHAHIPTNPPPTNTHVHVHRAVSCSYI